MKELEQYKIPIIFGAIGLVLAFKTLLIILLTGLGFAVGMYVQRTGMLDQFLKQ